MVKKILLWVLITLILMVLILFFINGGGFTGVVKSARTIPSIKDLILYFTSDSHFTLPGQDQTLGNLGLEIDTYGYGEGGYTAPAASEIGAPEENQAYGTLSPERGKVILSAANATASNPAEEYVVLSASYSNTASVNVSGWSLQSVVSGKRVYVPLAASPYVLGVVNRVSNALIPPGGTATFVSGISPIGVSFQETLCTGYLNQMQPFTPGLSNSCPSGDRVLAYTDENLARYGASCFDFIRSIPTCSLPSQVSATLSAACRGMLTSAFTYNGCLNANRSRSDFALNSHRLYGEFTRELWGNDHDTIRLLDGQGRTVDAVSY